MLFLGISPSAFLYVLLLFLVAIVIFIVLLVILYRWQKRLKQKDEIVKAKIVLAVFLGLICLASYGVFRMCYTSDDDCKNVFEETTNLKFPADGEIEYKGGESYVFGFSFVVNSESFNKLRQLYAGNSAYCDDPEMLNVMRHYNKRNILQVFKLPTRPGHCDTYLVFMNDFKTIIYMNGEILGCPPTT